MYCGCMSLKPNTINSRCQGYGGTEPLNVCVAGLQKMGPYGTGQITFGRTKQNLHSCVLLNTVFSCVCLVQD